MQTHTIFAFVLAMLLMLPSPGCSSGHPQAAIFSPQSDAQSSAAAQRFQQSSPYGRSAVESAVGLSERYTKLSEETATLKQLKDRLEAENLQLKNQLASAQSDLAQTKKELSEANDLLIEMRVELNNWKSNILGFRDEMRDADKAQLEALLKILKMLGGEVKSETAKSDNAEPNAPRPKP